MRGELQKYMDLSPRCAEHQMPCRTCAAKATLYQTGGIKNLKMIKKLEENMKAIKLMENLYQVQFEVQLKNNEMYNSLFPIGQNLRRMDQAIEETTVMLRRHYKKAPWAVMHANETVRRERMEGKI